MVMYANLYHAGRLLWPGGLKVRRLLRELERTQWFSPDELRAWQFARIQNLIRYAYDEVPYYRDRYRRLDIHPDDIRTWQDFQALPILTKEKATSNLDALVSSEMRGKIQPNETGGSTGRPFRFFVDESYHRWDAALELRGRGWYSAREGDKIALVWGAQRDMHMWDWRARLKAKIVRERYLNAYSMTESKIKAYAEMLVRWQPAMFRAYPTPLVLLAQYLKEKRITGIRPKFIETTAEKVTGPQRQVLEEFFQCPVADWYSARELGTIAFQCPNGGIHVAETRYLEIVSDDQVIEPGELGEVLVTSLNQFAMPFIRYRIDDLAIYEPSPCSCGRGLPVLRKIVGRRNDMIFTSDGLFVEEGYFALLFHNRPEIVRYQVYQPDRKRLEVRFVCKEKVDAPWCENVLDELQEHFGPNMSISLQIVDEIKLTRAGKHRYVISDVKSDFL
jgi:phenylacetate-CoA ligase